MPLSTATLSGAAIFQTATSIRRRRSSFFAYIITGR
jgi:hypothetical protein